MLTPMFVILLLLHMLIELLLSLQCLFHEIRFKNPWVYQCLYPEFSFKSGQRCNECQACIACVNFMSLFSNLNILLVTSLDL